MSLNVFLFYAIAALTGLSAIAMVVTQNIVRAAAWLLFTLAGVSGIYFLLGAEFVGATQLLIYVGGTLVLVIFGVMLTAQGPFVNLRPRAAEWVISMAVGLLLFGTLATSILTAKDLGADFEKHPPQGKEMTRTEILALRMLNVTEETRQYPITSVDHKILRDKEPKMQRILGTQQVARKSVGYLLPFEIVSVHLLVVLVGAAYLARTKRRKGESAPETEAKA